MKIEIEVTQDEIKEALIKYVRIAIADRVNQWGAQNYVKRVVNDAWYEAVDALVKEQLANCDTLKAKVQASIEAKIKGQINALMKEKK